MSDLNANSAPASRRHEAVERSLHGARQRAEQRTAALIEGALDLIGEGHGADFTLQELLDHTKLSLHAFYQLFPTKDDLLEAVLEESTQRCAVSLRRRVDERTEPVERLRAFVVGYLELATGHDAVLGSGPLFSELAVHLRVSSPGKAWRIYRPMRMLGYELFRAASDAGAIRGDMDAQVIAQFVLSSVRSVAELEFAESTVRTTGDQLWEMLAGGIMAPGQ